MHMDKEKKKEKQAKKNKQKMDYFQSFHNGWDYIAPILGTCTHPCVGIWVW